MKLILYYIYFILIAAPLLLSITILAATLTIVGSALGGGRIFGYWPGAIWGRLFCILSLVGVKVRGRDNISRGQSYVFVANHQGAFDIFSIYGYLGHNFRWMMKKSLERIPLVGYSCKVSGHIFVDNSRPSAVRTTMQTAEQRLAGGMSVVVFLKVHAPSTDVCTLSVAVHLPCRRIRTTGSAHYNRRGIPSATPRLVVITPRHYHTDNSQTYRGSRRRPS